MGKHIPIKQHNKPSQDRRTAGANSAISLIQFCSSSSALVYWFPLFCSHSKLHRFCSPSRFHRLHWSSSTGSFDWRFFWSGSTGSEIEEPMESDSLRKLLKMRTSFPGMHETLRFFWLKSAPQGSSVSLTPQSIKCLGTRPKTSW